VTNLKYDHVPDLVAAGDLNWGTDHIEAHLVKGVSFVGTHQRMSEIMVNPTSVTVRTTDVQGRSVSAQDEALGLPTAFLKVDPDISYQLLLVKDDGSGDDVLIAFYDEDENSAPLVVDNGGTMIVRPTLVPAGEPPTVGVWFVM
jgi:hypothetical protein